MLRKRFPTLNARLSVLEIGAGHKSSVLASDYENFEVQHASLLGLSATQLASHSKISAINSEQIKLDHHTSLVRIYLFFFTNCNFYV